MDPARLTYLSAVYVGILEIYRILRALINCNYGVRCGEMTELESREPIINTPPHLSRHPKGILEKEQFWLKRRKKRVRGCDRVTRS